MNNETDIVFKPFGNQKQFLKADNKIKGAFAGKRGGKTEVGAIQAILYQEQKPNYTPSKIDPYLGIIIAPTADMLRRLSLKKFLAYSKPFVIDHNKTNHEIKWHDNSEVLGISADKPERLEGAKANWIWIDEVFQTSEQLFLEAKARVSDQRGYLILTGSLGTQYVNPKQHWVYKYLKENPIPGSTCFEWSTADNPYFPKEELEELKGYLDIKTYKQMFELSWDVTPVSAVYHDFDDVNIRRHEYNPSLNTYVSIDWGWAHPMACLFFQHDQVTNNIYLFDEIVGSKIKIEDLWDQIKARNYAITGYCCDIAGNQEREQTGISNVEWFKKQGVKFIYATSAVQYGISIVRSHIRNAIGVARLFVDPKCKKSIDGIKNYKYQMKDGIILNENPLKENDDAVDSLRYFFINFIDENYKPKKVIISKYA